jgi:hypothetical protein
MTIQHNRQANMLADELIAALFYHHPFLAYNATAALTRDKALILGKAKAGLRSPPILVLLSYIT